MACSLCGDSEEDHTGNFLVSCEASVKGTDDGLCGCCEYVEEDINTNDEEEEE